MYFVAPAATNIAHSRYASFIDHHDCDSNLTFHEYFLQLGSVNPINYF